MISISLSQCETDLAPKEASSRQLYQSVQVSSSDYGTIKKTDAPSSSEAFALAIALSTREHDIFACGHFFYSSHIQLQSRRLRLLCAILKIAADFLFGLFELSQYLFIY